MALIRVKSTPILNSDGLYEGHDFIEYYVESAWRHEEWFYNYMCATGFHVCGSTKSHVIIEPMSDLPDRIVIEDDLPF